MGIFLLELKYNFFPSAENEGYTSVLAVVSAKEGRVGLLHSPFTYFISKRYVFLSAIAHSTLLPSGENAGALCSYLLVDIIPGAVSYTHLDVYKRQPYRKGKV